MTEFTTTKTVDPQRIADMFVGAIEGGSAYWCQGFVLSKLPVFEKTEGDIWYSNGTFWAADDYEVTAKFDDPDQPEGNYAGVKIIKPEDVQKGLQLMAEKYPRHFTDMIQEQDDATTADVFFQCVVLQDVIYG